jgi:hypothetical protein
MINWEYMIEKAFQNDIGYLPWVWKWTDCHAIVNNSTGAYGSWANTPWGERVAIGSPYSIKNTAQRPSEMQTGVAELLKAQQNLTAFPNPFEADICFKIHISSPSFVDLQISDLIGIPVRLLLHKQLNAGEYAFSWDPGEAGSSSSKGIYLYKLRIEDASGSRIETGKIIKL